MAHMGRADGDGATGATFQHAHRVPQDDAAPIMAHHNRPCHYVVIKHGFQVRDQIGNAVMLRVPRCIAVAIAQQVIGHHAIARFGECRHDPAPAKGKLWPAMDQNHRRTVFWAHCISRNLEAITGGKCRRQEMHKPSVPR